MSKRIIRGYWDCPYCGQKEIDGLLDACPNCSSGKNKDTKYYMKGQSPTTIAQSDILTNAELNKAGIEAEECDGEHKEWICLYCGYLNNYSNNKCDNCHADRSEAEEEYRGEDLKQKYAPTLGEDNYIATELSSDKNQEQNNADKDLNEHVESEFKKRQRYIDEVNKKIKQNQKSLQERNSSSAENHPKQSIWKSVFHPKTLAISLSVLLIISLLTFMLWPLQKTVTLTDYWWECAVNVEEERIVEEDGWSLPSNATLITTKEEIASYRQVLDHYETKTVQKSREVLSHYDEHVTYEDNGNGTFTEHVNRTPVYKTEYYTETVQEPVYRQEPVYQTRYYYTIPKWVVVQTYETSEHDKKPYYSTDYKLKEKERDTNRTEDYYLEFSDKSKQNVSKKEFNKAEIGQRYQITYNRFGGIYKNELISKNANLEKSR